MSFDIYGAAGAIIGAAADVVVKIGDAKKAKALIEELQKLSDKQMVELANKLQEVRTQIEKEGVIYKYLAIEKHKKELEKITITRIMIICGIGVGLAALALVGMKLKQKYE